VRNIHLWLCYLHLYFLSCPYSSINCRFHNHTFRASCGLHQMHPLHMLTSITNASSISTTSIGIMNFSKGWHQSPRVDINDNQLSNVRNRYAYWCLYHMEKIDLYIIQYHLFLHYFSTTQFWESTCSRFQVTDIACDTLNGLKTSDRTLTMHHDISRYKYTQWHNSPYLIYISYCPCLIMEV